MLRCRGARPIIPACGRASSAVLGFAMSAASSWFLRRPTSHALRLYCFPYAGGSAGAFMQWQALMEPYVEVCALQLPGRGSRIAEPPITSMDALVETIAAIIARQHDRPFAFFGHSLGALLAFETAHCLAKLGLPQPSQLLVSGSPAPPCRQLRKPLHLLPDAEFIRELQELNGTPEDVLRNHELMQLLLPSLRADFALASQYAYRQREPLSVPMNVLAGRQDTATDPQNVGPWARETTGACSMRWFDGDHFFIDTHRQDVAKFVCAEVMRLLPCPQPAAAI